jgi:hypothetical protein
MRDVLCCDVKSKKLEVVRLNKSSFLSIGFPSRSALARADVMHMLRLQSPF